MGQSAGCTSIGCEAVKVMVASVTDAFALLALSAEHALSRIGGQNNVGQVKHDSSHRFRQLRRLEK